MTPADFIRKWTDVSLTERSACHEHFLDLCKLLGHPSPVDLDKTGETFTFERGANKEDGGSGWADVWKKGFFGWEYKGPHANLDKAYAQLLRYRESLENPPLLVVCDLNLIVVHTNFTNTVHAVHQIPLAELEATRNLEILRAVFHHPEALRPGLTSQAITATAARHIGEIAQSLRARGEEPHAVARFLDRLVFCMFAEDIGLLQEKLFSRLLEKTKADPDRFAKSVAQLFEVMNGGGDFGMDTLRRFNGNLFAPGPVLSLTAKELKVLVEAARLDWAAVDPSIFGTLFERGLDPQKRAQLGAHYTSREDIEVLVRAVVMVPLRREWDDVRAEAEKLLDRSGAKSKTGRDKLTAAAGLKTISKAADLIADFVGRLAEKKILDPACGSGNFLYVTLQEMKALEKEAINWAADHRLQPPLPMVHPRQFYGLEINPYAYELAQMTLWIGYLQWIHANAIGHAPDPVLETLAGNFQNIDAILGLECAGLTAPCSAGGLTPASPENTPRQAAAEKSAVKPAHSRPCEPEWPAVDFIIGNPPFLGGNRIRGELGDTYIEKLFAFYEGRVPAFADLCCYWFEKARKQIEEGKCQRAGLLATQAIRGGANREVLKRIKETGDIFFAESDRDWILDGASVHVSMIGFDGGREKEHILDQTKVSSININLTTAVDISSVNGLQENKNISFQGPSPKAAFDIPETLARELLSSYGIDGKPMSDVIRPLISAIDITGGIRSLWTIDFRTMEINEASKYESAFEYLKREVYPVRSKNRRESYAKKWWQYAEARPGLRKALIGKSHFLVTPCHSKYRIYIRLGSEYLSNQATIVFINSDDYFFGVLQSRFHEVWSLKLGTRLETRPRYTPTTCFETFPFPEATETQREEIAAAARELDGLRSAWLNPPEWTREEVLEFPGSVDGPWSRFITGGTGILPVSSSSDHALEGHATSDYGLEGHATVRYPRLVPKDAASAALLKKRTLTALYNQRPTWLDLAHAKLDAAVSAAYSFPPDLPDEQILARLLEMNLGRSQER